MACDEDVVRRLFRGATLPSAELPEVLRAYEHACGTPMIPPALAGQIETFAAENADLEIGCDAFVSMVRSLHDSADSDRSETEDVLENSALATTTSPDTTFESESNASPQKGMTRSAYSEHNIHSMHQEHGDARRSALVRKLARVSDRLERLQTEHDALLVTKDAQDAAIQHLERQCASLMRDVQHAQEQERESDVRARELDTRAHELHTTLQAQQRHAEQARVELEATQRLTSALESDLQAREEECDALKQHCDAYVSEKEALQETCAAQRTAITKLEDTVEALERAHATVEHLQTEYAAFQAMHTELASEIASMRHEATPRVLAVELGTRRSRAQSAPPLCRGCLAPHTTDLLPMPAARGVLDVSQSGASIVAPEAAPEAIHEAASDPHAPEAHRAPSTHAPFQTQDTHAQRELPHVPETRAGRVPAAKTAAAPRSRSKVPACFPVRVARAWVRSPAVLLFLGAWLGIWVYYAVLQLTSLSHNRWAEANLLYDPLAWPGLPQSESAFGIPVYRS